MPTSNTYTTGPLLPRYEPIHEQLTCPHCQRDIVVDRERLLPAAVRDLEVLERRIIADIDALERRLVSRISDMIPQIVLRTLYTQDTMQRHIGIDMGLTQSEEITLQPNETRQLRGIRVDEQRRDGIAGALHEPVSNQEV